MKPTEAWAELGSSGELRLGAVALDLVELPFVEPVHTAAGTHRSRPLVMVHLAGTREGTPFEGWGECAALADTFYDDEDAPRSLRALEETVVPALVEEVRRNQDRLPRPSGLERVRQEGHATPLAFAALEMAVADAHLRAEGRSLANLLGVEGRGVGVGAVLGQFDSLEAVAVEAVRIADTGITRLKLKISPGWDVEPLDAVSRAAPGLRLQADANGSYREADSDHLAELDRFGLLCLEQPFDRADLDGHVRLARRMRTPVCLDESIHSPASVRRALDMGACSVVCVKPARLGGVGATLELVESCAEAGTPMWMGGMFESGYARGVNTTLAAMDGFAWPGDLTPARWYLGDDLVPDPELTRLAIGGGLTAFPPRSAGMGPVPDPGTLKRYSTWSNKIEVAG